MNRELGSRNRKTMLACVTVFAGMVGLTLAAVPLYDLFTSVTGFAGTVRTATKSSGTVVDRVMRVRFDASTNTALPWRFAAVQREMSMKIGTTAKAYYRAENIADETVTGRATFNVTPYKAAKYFNKIKCFCFNELRLAAGESVELPVTFFIDPEIVNDPNLEEVRTVTLSYTFFRIDSKNEATNSVRMGASVSEPRQAMN